MKIDCVLTACNHWNLYFEFIPYFIKTWNKLYPEIDVKIIYIHHEIPKFLKEYEKNLILFPEIEGLSTSFIAQYIRLLYPAILDYKNGILITDIDMIPMNKTYFTKPVENISDDKFIVYRNVISMRNMYPMCYNLALNKTWSEIFNISSLEDIKNRLIEVNSKINFTYRKTIDWCIDQHDLFKIVNNWNEKTNNIEFINDKQWGFKRICRKGFRSLNEDLIQKIKNHEICDYACHRPFRKNRELCEKIYELL